MNHANRRTMVRRAFAAGGLLACKDLLAEERKAAAPNARLKIGVVGVGGQGAANLAGVGHEDVVALADVDGGRLAKAQAAFPHAKGYADFRELLDKHPDLDAWVVSTPDHTHAYVALAGMKRGLHCYCEKPLAHSLAEVRAMRNIAAEKKLVTQMGTQIHAGANYRRVVELVRSGVLGAISEVQVWFGGRPPSFAKKTLGTPPKALRYDLWLGPLPEVPYVAEQSHFNWRYWWQFGNGVFGDFGCHFADLAFWALELGAPTAVTATGKKDHAGVNDVPALQQVDYEFPAAAGRGPVRLTWRHGGAKPAGTEDFPLGNAVLFVGADGRLAADYGSKIIRPDGLEGKAAIKDKIPESLGHHREWLQAIRTGGPTTCNFGYSGNLTEAVLLGNVAYRTAPGKRLEWRADELAFANDAAAQQLVHREYRDGWTP